MKLSKRVLVTGGAGFIGSNLVRFLVNETDATVLNVDRLTYAGNLNSLAGMGDHANYAFVQLDLNESDALNALVNEFRPDMVLNLAAETHVDRSIDSPLPFLHSNVNGTYWLLESIRQYLPSHPNLNDFRFIQISTDEVYGSLAAQAPASKENDPYLPSSPYSATKAAADHLVWSWWKTYNVPTIITRCSNNYGPYQHCEKFIPKIIACCVQGNRIPIYGTGKNIRDWIFVEDHVEALVAIAEAGEPGQTYNIGGQCQWTNFDLVKLICNKLDASRTGAPELWKAHTPISGPFEELIDFVEDRKGHDLRYSLDIAKLQNELGWTPKTSLESGLDTTIEWYLRHSDWWLSRS